MYLAPFVFSLSYSLAHFPNLPRKRWNWIQSGDLRMPRKVIVFGKLSQKFAKETRLAKNVCNSLYCVFEDKNTAMTMFTTNDCQRRSSHSHCILELYIRKQDFTYHTSSSSGVNRCQLRYNTANTVKYCTCFLERYNCRSDTCETFCMQRQVRDWEHLLSPK